MHDLNVSQFLANLLVILFSAKLFGEVAGRFKQPAVLGELLGGVLLGCGFLSFFHPQDPVLSLMAEFGVIILLFETGLESDLSQLMKVGPVSLAVACVGVVLPFVLGYALMSFLGHSGIRALLIGAAMTATSIGITARVLADSGKLQMKEAQIILGAAVIDDIIGVILLSVIQTISVTGHASWKLTAWSTLLAFGFIGAALLVGPRLTKSLIRIVEQMKGRGALITAAICFAFAFSLAAHALGTALIIGAFAAGILLAQTEHKVDIHSALKPVADIFVPIFFVMVGAKVDLRPFNPSNPGAIHLLELSLLLVVIAIISKILCGWAAWGKGLNRWGIGIGMIPRGEVGLIFAQIGLASQVLDSSLYSALIAMVVVTTFITPPLLERIFHRST